LLTLLGRLDSRLGILQDCNGTVPTDCFMTITVAAVAILLVMAQVDVTLAVIDP